MRLASRGGGGLALGAFRPAPRFRQSTRRWVVASVSAAPSSFPEEAKAVSSSQTVSVTFVDPNGEGSVIHAQGQVGQSIMEVAKAHGVEIHGACGGKLQCATCHVIMEHQQFERLPPIGVREQDLLDTTFTLTETSRLGCQVKLRPDMEGMRLTLPDASAKGSHRMSLDQPRPKVSTSWTDVPASMPSLRKKSMTPTELLGRFQTVNGRTTASEQAAATASGMSQQSGQSAEAQLLTEELATQKRLAAHLESEIRQLRYKLASAGEEKSCSSGGGSCSSSSGGTEGARKSADAGSQKKPKEAISEKSAEADGGEEAEIEKAKAQLQRTRVDGAKLAGKVSFADIIGLDSAKQALHEALLWPAMADPSLFSGVRSQMRGLLLYGPPGCGKTMLARAAAAELCNHAAFFHVQPGDIMSKFYGDSQIRVLALQELVREASPAVVFFDEVDTLLSSRDASGIAEHHRATTNALLAWMDGFATNEQDERVFFLGATNRPEAIDEAALRRFGAAAEVAAPSEEARCALLRYLVSSKAAEQGHLADMEEDDLMVVAKRTQGFSLADVDRLVRNSFLEVLRQLPAPGIQPGLKPSHLPPVKLQHFEAVLAGQGGTGTAALSALLEKQAQKRRAA